MPEIQENPASSVKNTDISLNLIKNVPKENNIKASLMSLRNEHGYNPEGIWSDARLQTAVDGMSVYVDVYNMASEQLKKHLNNTNIISGFIGVRPIVSLANQDPKTLIINSNFYDRGEDLLFLKVHEEFKKLLDTRAQGKIRLERIDYSKVKYKNIFSYELMNTSAIQNVANENPDLFRQSGSISPTEWLIQNPDVWPMTPQSNSEDAKIKEIRSGVLSGFPRSASNKYAEEATSEIDLLRSLKKIVKGSKNVNWLTKMTEYTPILNQDVKTAQLESGLPYMHYSESDLKWTKDAAALLKHSVKLFGLSTLKQ